MDATYGWNFCLLCQLKEMAMELLAVNGELKKCRASLWLCSFTQYNF